MPARLTVHDPDGAAQEYWLEPDGGFVFGRGEGADIRVRDGSISRHHLRIDVEPGRCRIEDLGSKNGLLVDGEAVGRHVCERLAWLQAGDLLLELEPCTAEVVQIGRARRMQRTQRSQTLRISAGPADQGFLGQCLEAVAELSECEHTALVLPDGSGFRVVEVRDATATVVAPSGFRGSHAALRRAVASRAPVVVNDLRRDAQLAGRQSVLQGGILSLMVLPLLDDGSVSGLLYADRRGPGQPITAFDLDLVAAFAERMSLWLAARRCLATLESWPEVVDAAAAPSSAAAA